MPTVANWLHWSDDERRLWRRWTIANGVGEVVGLGLVGVVGVVLAAGLADGGIGPIALAALLVGLGTVEGAVVGYAQWRAMRGAFRSLDARSWVGATAAGAFVAWTVGVAPSTLGAVGTPSGGPAEPPLPVVLGLASLLGIVAGVLLSGAQWLVLRRHATTAWWWLPANAVAWAVGMPVVFAGASAIPAGPPDAASVLVVLATAGAAGLVVGAIHGVVLVRLAR